MTEHGEERLGAMGGLPALVGTCFRSGRQTAAGTPVSTGETPVAPPTSSTRGGTSLSAAKGVPPKNRQVILTRRLSTTGQANRGTQATSQRRRLDRSVTIAARFLGRPGRGTRRGLSTLELVLSLPLLLFVMALMINFGTVASWRVRELSVARHAAWASRYPRHLATDVTGARRKLPCWWPEGATMAVGTAGHLNELDDPRVDHPVVQGPLPGGALVNEDLLDPTRGLLRGAADLSREFPLLARLGPYHMEAEELLLDRQWQHREMGWDVTGESLWTTYTRRMPVIHALPQADAGLVDAYVSAVIAIIYGPFHADLAPLDRDDEFIYYSQRFAASGTFPYHGAPEFHPRLTFDGCSWPCKACCDSSSEYVKKRVESLVKRIKGGREGRRRIPSVAQRMADAFISLYEAVQEELQRQIDAGAQNAAALQAEIDALEQKINTLEQFKAGLPH